MDSIELQKITAQINWPKTIANWKKVKVFEYEPISIKEFLKLHKNKGGVR